MRLTWADLMVPSFSAEDLQRWLKPWSSLVGGPIGVEFMSMFGVWFFRRPDGTVGMLDVLSGAVEPVAENYDEFVASVNDPQWQEAYFCSKLVFQLHQEGKVPKPGQCYALAPHPALGGRNPMQGESVDTQFVFVMDIDLWQDLCVQSVFGPRGG
jgi:hypothetical protein